MTLTTSMEAICTLDEVAGIDQINVGIATLESYYQTISAVGGVSREQAAALVEDCGMQLDDRFPLESFTVMPSRTNHTVALEGILDRATTLLMDLLKKAAALLRKLISWIVEFIRSRRAKNHDIGKKVAQIKAVSKANVELAATNGLQHRGPMSSSNAMEAPLAALTAASERYEGNYSDLVDDLLASGKFSGVVRNLSFHLFKISPLLKDKLELFHKVLHDPRMGAEADIVAHSELNTVATPIPVNDIAQALESVGIHVSADGDKVTFQDTMRALFDRYQVLRTSKSHETRAIEQVSDLLASKGVTILAPFIVAPDAVMRDMIEIDRELKKIQTLSTTDVATDKIRAVFQSALRTMLEETNALQTFITIVEGCSYYQERLIDDVWRYEEKQFLHYRAKAALIDDGDTIRAVNGIQDSLKKALNTIK